MRIRDVLRYHLLGPLAVERGGASLALGPPKQRALLAVLAQEAGAVVSTDRIVDSVWGDDHPASVQSSLHANVSRLRRLLRDDPSSPPPIVRRSGGYLLDVDRAEVDVALFLERANLAATAVGRGEWSAAVQAADGALGLWRGGYLDDLRDEEWVRVAAGPLNEYRAGARQNLVIGLLGTGDVAAALARSTVLLAEQDLVERATWLHMITLYRAGRTAEALETYRGFSARMDAELGLDAGPALRDLHGAILRQDPDIARWPGRDERIVVGIVEPEVPKPSAAIAPQMTSADAAPLVGRADETRGISEALTAARTNGARWVVISGPAGMGKTRLAEHAMDGWVADGGRVVRGQCPDLDEVPAGWPIRQLLRSLGAEADVRLEQAGFDVDVARFAVFEHAASVVRAQVAQRPLLIVVDDVHWGDRESLAFLTFLAETVTDPGLAVIVTTRHTRGRPELERLLGALARRPDSRQIGLSALSVGEVAHLVELVSGERPADDDAAGMATRTGGTPFYVIEYARLPGDQRRGEFIPAAVRTVLRQRFSRLPPDLLETVQAAAVLGEPMDVPMLAAVTGRNDIEVSDLLDDAADLDLLRGSPDSAAYGFAHALLREELAAGMAELRRARLHLRAAELLAGSDTLTDLLRRARHLLSAGRIADPQLAYRAFRAAAHAADERWMYDAAASWWQAAVDAYDRLSETDPDERDANISAQLRAMAWLGQGQAVLDVLDAALIEALRAGRTESVGRLAANLLRVSGSWPWPVYGSDPAPLMVTLSGLDGVLRDDPAARARVLAVTAIGRCYDPDPSVPDDLSRRAIELAEQTGDDAVLADALLGRALTYAGVASRSAESIELCDRLATLKHETAAADDVLRRNIATMALLNLGRTTECAEFVQIATVGADVLRLPINRVQLRWAEAALAQWQGDLPRAAELYERAELAHRRTELQQAGTFELAQLSLLWDQGRLDELPGPVPSNPMVSQWTRAAAAAATGSPEGDEALAVEVRRFEPEVWTSHGRWALLAHCVADRGLCELAPPLLAALAPVRDCVAAFGQCGVLGPVALAMARLSRLLGDLVTARNHLDRAFAVAQRSGGAAALVHCRLEAATWAVTDAQLTPELRAELVAIAHEADVRGMSGIARRARDLQ
ncbi:AAA family ATPase [Jatrophihabitans telluris]|uniref:AAA family ATPase n=1 Tax=Jatrophihabitans telluris TaxID=2038343 RepID=A0ABY4QV06_9ACTN|nr:BTAD domain-containing putative transcriptional regulator [Jatrophihabitans telluris]UQX86886.1 AAA family ATPase [Jatrophihabitans telluris]